MWHDAWTFRIVDQDTGAAVPGVPVTVLPEESGEGGGHWVSDADGLVRIPKHDQSRLRLRVGLRTESPIEFDARSLGDSPIPIAAPPAGTPGAAMGPGVSRESVSSVPSLRQPMPAGHLIRFARIAVLPKDRGILGTVRPDIPESYGGSPDPGAIRYGAVLEVDQVWQSHGARPGDVLYTISLGPGEEVQVLVWDGRWRRKADSRERAFHIVTRMAATRRLAGNVDALPLDPCVLEDLEITAADTVRLLADRTGRATEALRRRPLGVAEMGDEQPPAGATVRTLRNMRPEGVLSYHIVEPVERYQVIVRTPRPRPVMLVPFRMPNIATPAVVRRFGHAVRRSLIDRALGADLELALGTASAPESERRICAHIAEHLPYYSAAIIAADSPERFLALAKLREPGGRPLTDVIENQVVGRVGTYVAFPLRSLAHAPPELRTMLDDAAVQRIRVYEEMNVTLPLPGVWLRSELFPAHLAGEKDAGADTTHVGKSVRR
jgi:hypothetical protein